MSLLAAHEGGLSEPTGAQQRADWADILRALLGAGKRQLEGTLRRIILPRQHPTLGWGCAVASCVRGRHGTGRFCNQHVSDWKREKQSGKSLAEFESSSQGYSTTLGRASGPCRICIERSAYNKTQQLCRQHDNAFRYELYKVRSSITLDDWIKAQSPFRGLPACLVKGCDELSSSPLSLCRDHGTKYRDSGSPGGVRFPRSWHQRYESGVDLDDLVTVRSVKEFRLWTRKERPTRRSGEIDLHGVSELIALEIRYILECHAESTNAPWWPASAISKLADSCRILNLNSLMDVTDECYADPQFETGCHSFERMILVEAVARLRLVYFAKEDTRALGFIETEHFGRRFKHTRSLYVLTNIKQIWLRDLVWDRMAFLLSSVNCPRSRGPFDHLRRAAIELSSFLTLKHKGEVTAGSLTAKDAEQFVSELFRRERLGESSFSLTSSDGSPTTVTSTTRRLTFNALRSLLQWSLEGERNDRVSPEFALAIPYGGRDPKASRRPYNDEVLRKLVDETNLTQLETLDPYDRGARDIWECIVNTGRRCGEVIELRLNCVERIHGLPYLWHDQTKVDRYDASIRIPENLFHRLEARVSETVSRYERRHGRVPSVEERSRIALFPSPVKNDDFARPLSYGFFNSTFGRWLREMGLQGIVAHQARHTFATSLLRAGADLVQLRKFLGHVSTRMTENYLQVAQSDLEDILRTVWVSGPGSEHPGRVVSPQTPVPRPEKVSIAIDLLSQGAPAEGGVCTFQPVVRGGACPKNLDCGHCESFVMSGADLLYWRRKREQWSTLAERAPDPATRDYLHDVFEPTGVAIDALESELERMEILDQALNLDLRRPQDYFSKVWRTAFPVEALTQGES